MQQGRHIYSSLQRWADGPISCFGWPTSVDIDQFIKLTDLIGEVVYSESKMPNWRYRIAHGINATTPRTAEVCDLTYTPGSIFLGKWCLASGRFGYYQYDGDLFKDYAAVWDRPSAPSTVIHNATRDEALQRAVANARSKQTHFRGGNFVAELADTIRGLRNPAKGFRDLLDTYRKNARKRVKNAVGRRSLPRTQQDFRRLEKDAPNVGRAAQRALSDTWLEHNFGWAPLLSDAVDAYKAIRALSARTPLERFFGRSSNIAPPTFVTNNRLHDAVTLWFTVRTQLAYDVTYYGAVKVECDAPPSGQAIEEMGVRARDFIPAVWEAIPYSFLIDYFTNVGNVIEAVSFPRSDLAWISQTFRNHSMRSTERVAIDGFYSPSWPASNSCKVFSFQPPRVEWDRKYISRSVYSGSLIPRLRFEIPGAKNWRKWLNVAALARMRTL
jgi:hypothetical protein